MFVDDLGRQIKKDNMLWIHGANANDPWELYLVLTGSEDHIVVSNLSAAGNPQKISKTNWLMLKKNDMVRGILSKSDLSNTEQACLIMGPRFFTRITRDMIKGDIRHYLLYPATFKSNPNKQINVWGYEEYIKSVCEIDKKVNAKISQRDTR